MKKGVLYFPGGICDDITRAKDLSMLTPKQEKFIGELLKGKTQREAYKAAYNTSKWTDKSIDEAACRLLRNSKVNSRYKELKESILQKDVDDAESIRKMIIEQEKAILNANMGDLFDVQADESGEGLVSVPKGDLSKFDMRAVKSYKYDSRGRLILELFDKQQAVAHLKDLFGLSMEEEKEDIQIILQKEADAYAN